MGSKWGVKWDWMTGQTSLNQGALGAQGYSSWTLPFALHPPLSKPFTIILTYTWAGIDNFVGGVAILVLSQNI